MQALMLNPAAVEARARRILRGLDEVQEQLSALRSCTTLMIDRLRDDEETEPDER
jgi:hypothetical protein